MNLEPTRINRRAALERLGAGTLLALGLWPGALRAGNETPSGTFRFITVNDTHCMSKECGPYLEGVVAQMRTADVEFCLHAGDLTEKGDRRHMETVKEIFGTLPGEFYPVPGNHDYVTQTNRRDYTRTFALRVNYYFHHRGWQFIPFKAVKNSGVNISPSRASKATTTRFAPPNSDWYCVKVWM